MALAIEAARAAVEACEKGGFYIGASVINTSGQPRAMVESDGSDGGHVSSLFAKRSSLSNSKCLVQKQARKCQRTQRCSHK